MTEDVQTQQFPQESVNVVPIINNDSRGNTYRYFKIQNGEFKDVVFTITEVDFVKKGDLPDFKEGEDPEEMTATGRVVFENTMSFTSSQLLNNHVFGAIARDIFDKIVTEIKEALDDNQEDKEEVSEDATE